MSLLNKVSEKIQETSDLAKKHPNTTTCVVAIAGTALCLTSGVFGRLVLGGVSCYAALNLKERMKKQSDDDNNTP